MLLLRYRVITKTSSNNNAFNESYCKELGLNTISTVYSRCSYKKNGMTS